MARFFWALVLAMFGIGLVAGPAALIARADDKKNEKKKDEKKSDDKELKGSAMCAKCELKDKAFPKCQTVLIVKEDGKEVKYYFDEASEKKHHSDYCKGRHDVTVKGKVTEKDGKKWVAVTSIDKKKA